MSRDGPVRLAERKALLLTRAQLDRARMMIAVHEIRGLVRPTLDTLRREQARSTAALIVGAAVPLFGRTRVGRLVRVATLGLTVYRIVRNWRSPG